MKILAIETATEACSAALSINGKIRESYEVAPQKHAELILVMVDKLLSDSGIRLKDLDLMAFGRGPGAFTGVRIATGVIQGLAFGAGKPVVPVSTLAVLAQGAIDHSTNIFSAIDARMQEVYWCRYEVVDGLVVPLDREAVNKPAQIILEGNLRWFGVGSGWATYPGELTKAIDDQVEGMDGDRFPHARDIIPLALAEYKQGNSLEAAQALPVYLRNQVTD